MILSREECVIYCQHQKAASKRIAFTNGCFDILHAGHVFYLERARATADCLIVGVNSDDSVRRLKGDSRPLNSLNDRLGVLNALRAVDAVCAFDEDTPLELIEALQPDVLIKGGDYTPQTVVGADFVLSHGGRVEIIPFVEGKSTSSIVSRIRNA